jgi:hypothetical protein
MAYYLRGVSKMFEELNYVCPDCDTLFTIRSPRERDYSKLVEACFCGAFITLISQKDLVG